MKELRWEIQPLAPPSALRYCKRCAGKRAFYCSGQFRVNAQRRLLDVWLIYRCACCDTTWNLPLCSRVPPQSLGPALLDGFFSNDPALAARYAADPALLQKNGAEVLPPPYVILGESVSPREPAAVSVRCAIPLSVKVSALVREKLDLSQAGYRRLILSGQLRSVPEQDLLKCRLGRGIELRFYDAPHAFPGE